MKLNIGKLFIGNKQLKYHGGKNDVRINAFSWITASLRVIKREKRIRRTRRRFKRSYSAR